MTPSTRKRVTLAWLNQQFNDQDWEAKLKLCTRAEIYNSLTPKNRGQIEGTHTIGHDYYDAEKAHIATVFYFLKPDGSLGASGKKRPMALLIDGIWCYI